MEALNFAIRQMIYASDEELEHFLSLCCEKSFKPTKSTFKRS
jgi:hypothetical protein